jgi:hypothetical protein
VGDTVTVSDPELIRQALDSSVKMLWSWDEYYEMTVYLERSYIDGATEARRVYLPADSEIARALSGG